MDEDKFNQYLIVNLYFINNFFFFSPRKSNAVPVFLSKCKILRPIIHASQYYTLLNQSHCRYFVY